MGSGEDFMDKWLPFMEQLGPDGRRAYLDAHSAPEVWRHWFLELVENLWSEERE